jgi:hypothetical protein
MLLDTALHVPGLGRLLTLLGTWVAQACMLAFTISFTGAWRPGYRRALATFCLVALMNCILWAVMFVLVGGRLEQFAYHFYGRPAIVLAWNLASCATCLFGFGLGNTGYMHVLHTASDRHSRFNARAAIAVGFAGMLYNALLMVAAIANRYGMPASGVNDFGAPLLWGAVAVMVVVTWVAIFGRPLWRWLRRLLALRRQLDELRQVRRELLNGTVLLGDRLVQLHGYADQAIVKAVIARCAEWSISGYRRRVGAEAARWITIERRNAGTIPWSDTESQEWDGAIVADALRRAESDAYFYADVFRVVALALDREALPELEPLRAAKDWRLTLAELLKDVLATYRNHAPMALT